MTEDTPLDRAHAAMTAAPEDDAARLAFHERLADAELFLLLTEEPAGDDISPELFEVAGGRFLLAFDREARLGDFTGRPAPYAAMSGRTLAGMLAGSGIGLGLNLGAPSETLLPPETLDWLARTLAERPSRIEARPVALSAPDVPERLVTALDTKLATAAGLARRACLAGVTWESGARGHMLAFIDALPGAEDALARAAGEALTFSGIEAGELDVAFFAAADPVTPRLEKVALRFDLPELAPPEPSAPSAPGTDPDRPPRLR